MNWYLFALFCEGLVALLMVFGMMFYTGCQTFLAKTKAEETEKMVKNICEEVVGRTIHTLGDECRDLMDDAMKKTKEMVEDTFTTKDES